MTSTTSSFAHPLRGAAAHLAGELRAGRVYRREDLAHLSTAVDRHLRELVNTGKLKKLAQGLYHAPKQSSFGPLPPTDEQVVEAFLRDKGFLIFSPSAYNTLGLGTTQRTTGPCIAYGSCRNKNFSSNSKAAYRYPKALVCNAIVSRPGRNAGARQWTAPSAPCSA